MLITDIYFCQSIDLICWQIAWNFFHCSIDKDDSRTKCHSTRNKQRLLWKCYGLCSHWNSRFQRFREANDSSNFFKLIKKIRNFLFTKQQQTFQKIQKSYFWKNYNKKPKKKFVPRKCPNPKISSWRVWLAYEYTQVHAQNAYLHKNHHVKLDKKKIKRKANN